MSRNNTIKCVVWDLDNTLWEGILLEDTKVTLKENIFDTIKELDKRGILQSIASRNNFEDAMDKLREFGISEYFLFPQINWGNKSESIRRIYEKLNIHQNTIAFIDDQQYELDEVQNTFSDVLCIHADGIFDLLQDERFRPEYITEDTKRRREMYIADNIRNRIEEEFKGPKEEFLKSLDMKLFIKRAEENDLDRVIELTERTNQLNTTGYTYSYDELRKFQDSDQHYLLIIGLEDKYGSSGKIGLILIKKNNCDWMIELLIMSCRVMSRGIGTIILNYILIKVKELGVNLYAKFIPTDRNKMMLMSYTFSGFQKFKEVDNMIILQNSLNMIQKLPGYVQIIDEKGW